ncbi:hypothetical protein A0H81_07964 [Grifola frondosa]|uniref:F-box domain-containing protein n=1 Tax=Grifola frondosa TaxID=5627 RepID=A0A1C7MB55_GRIFR|nr:hypothetical protein A0H81_07964 [Grifola frondosa]
MIGFQETRDPTDVLHTMHFDLSRCAGLRSLRISCSPLHHSSYRPSLSWILIILSKVNSPFLQEITFSIRHSDLCALNLEGLEVILSHARFKALKRITFDIEQVKDCTIDISEAYVRKRMCAHDTRGILCFKSSFY